MEHVGHVEQALPKGLLEYDLAGAVQKVTSYHHLPKSLTIARARAPVHTYSFIVLI